MFGKKEKKPVRAIDVTKKKVKTWWGGQKLVPTSKREQKKLKEMIHHIDPSIIVIDDAEKKAHELDWIDHIEELDALL